jgi:LysR family transcriptional regulator, benzoate and cis,cis-muconate-responsive activator of ben and cat genes
MELRHLRYFVAVAEELHFGRAAKRLHITQPPLSQQIQLLERELGVKLLIRGRKVQLTNAGHVLLEEARRTIEVAERAARAARAAGAGEAARLRIGYPAATLVELVPAAFRTFAERFPDVGIEAVAGHTGGLLSALRDDQLDIAVLAMNGHDSETVCSKLLHREPLVLAVPDNHPLANRAALAMTDLAEQSMILLPRALDPLHEHLPNVVLADTPATPLTVHEAVTLESAYSAVAARLGVAVVAESTARIMAVRGVAHRPFAPPQPVLDLSVAWPHRRTSTAVRSFLIIVAELTAALDVATASPPRLACPTDDADR